MRFVLLWHVCSPSPPTVTREERWEEIIRHPLVRHDRRDFEACLSIRLLQSNYSSAMVRLPANRTSAEVAAELIAEGISNRHLDQGPTAQPSEKGSAAQLEAYIEHRLALLLYTRASVRWTIRRAFRTTAPAAMLVHQSCAQTQAGPFRYGAWLLFDFSTLNPELEADWQRYFGRDSSPLGGLAFPVTTVSDLGLTGVERTLNFAAPHFAPGARVLIEVPHDLVHQTQRLMRSVGLRVLESNFEDDETARSSPLWDQHDATVSTCVVGAAPVPSKRPLAPLIGVSGVIVINLPRRSDRWSLMLERAATAGFQDPATTFERLDGVYGSDLLESREPHFQKMFDLSDWHYGDGVLNPHQDHGWRIGVLGCAASHLKAWRRIAQSAEHDPHSVHFIFEDDAEFASNFSAQWSATWDVLRNDYTWDAVWLGSIDNRQLDGDIPIHPGVLQISSEQPRAFGGGAFGIMLRARTAQWLVDRAETRGIQQAIDWWYTDAWAERNEHIVYRVTPDLVVSDSSPTRDTDNNEEYDQVRLLLERFDENPSNVLMLFVSPTLQESAQEPCVAHVKFLANEPYDLFTERNRHSQICFTLDSEQSVCQSIDFNFPLMANLSEMLALGPHTITARLLSVKGEEMMLARQSFVALEGPAPQHPLFAKKFCLFQLRMYNDTFSKQIAASADKARLRTAAAEFVTELHALLFAEELLSCRNFPGTECEAGDTRCFVDFVEKEMMIQRAQCLRDLWNPLHEHNRLFMTSAQVSLFAHHEPITFVIEFRADADVRPPLNLLQIVTYCALRSFAFCRLFDHQIADRDEELAAETSSKVRSLCSEDNLTPDACVELLGKAHEVIESAISKARSSQPIFLYTVEGMLHELFIIDAKHSSSDVAARLCKHHTFSPPECVMLTSAITSAVAKRAHRSGPYRIQVSGEPKPNKSPALFDLNILAGGRNLDPNSFFLPLLAHEKGWALDEVKPGKSVSERSIDVLYRSSQCVFEREALAQIVREKAEACGLVFVSAGNCKAGRAYRDSTPKFDWGTCDECGDAKIIISFEKPFGRNEYLSEKPFLALVHGAVGVYHGNGQTIMHEIGLNTQKFLDRDNFESDEAFGDAIAELAQDEARLDTMRRLPNYAHGKSPDINVSAIRAHSCADPRLSEVRDAQEVIRVYTSNRHVPPRLWEWLPEALCLRSEAKLVWEPETGSAHITVESELWGATREDDELIDEGSSLPSH